MTDTATPENICVVSPWCACSKRRCHNHSGGKENPVSAHHAVGRRLGGLQLAGDGAIREAKKCRDN